MRTHLGSTTKTPGVEVGKYVEGDHPRKQSGEILLTHRTLLIDNVAGKLQLPHLAHADEITEDGLALIVAPFLKLQCRNTQYEFVCTRLVICLCRQIITICYAFQCRISVNDVNKSWNKLRQSVVHNLEQHEDAMQILIFTI